jgi:hypothetical protein
MKRLSVFVIIAIASFPAAAQTEAGIFYEVSTCILRRIVIPDDDAALGTIHIPTPDEKMVIVDRSKLPMATVDGIEIVDVRRVETCKKQ